MNGPKRWLDETGAAKAGIARETGLSRKTVQSFFATGNGNPRTQELIAAFFGISIADLLMGPRQKKPNASEPKLVYNDDSLEIVMVSVYKLIPSAGLRSAISTRQHPVGRTLVPNQATVLFEITDTDFSVYAPGDLVLIDTEDQTLVDGDVFLISVDGRPGELHRAAIRHGEWIFTRDNPTIPAVRGRVKVLGAALGIIYRPRGNV